MLYLSNLQPWQPLKIYFGSDANDEKQFNGSGPAYSVREVSPSQKKPYWRLALESAMSHRTQFPDDIERISKMSDEELEKMMNAPNTAWWSEPSTLIFGKSVVGGIVTDDVFAHIDEKPVRSPTKEAVSCGAHGEEGAGNEKLPRVELGGPWQFYAEFYPAHGLCQLPVAKVPEIRVQAGSTLVVPVVMHHEPTGTLPVNLTVKAPEGWKVGQGARRMILPAEESTSLAVHIETPALSSDELNKAVPQEVQVSAEAGGQQAGEVRLRVLLRATALPQ